MELSCLYSRGIQKRKGFNMKKQFFALVCSLILLCGMVLGTADVAKAAEDSLKCVDGSYLTMESSSAGSTSSSLERGEHLMDGESIISNPATGKIYAYGATTANHTVDYVGLIVYVERYNPQTGYWNQVTTWTVEKRNAYNLSSGKTLTVERGYYYRVRCSHYAGNDAEFPYDMTVSFTDGIWIG